MIKDIVLLNTRPIGYGDEFKQEFERLGGRVISFPTLSIEPLAKTWLDELPEFESWDYALFISRSAVRHALQVMPEWPKLKIIAIGEATKKELIEHGLSVDITPPMPNSESLLAMPELANMHGKSVIIFKGEGGRELLHQSLLARGANVHFCDVYKRVKPKSYDSSQLKQANLVLFTSRQGMLNAFEMINDEHWLQNTACIVISQRLKKIAQSMGITQIIVAEDGNIVKALNVKTKEG